MVPGERVAAVLSRGAGYVAVGMRQNGDASAADADAWYSSDGVHFSHATITGGSDATMDVLLAAPDGSFVALGEDGYSDNTQMVTTRGTAVWTSPDGRAWTRQPLQPSLEGALIHHVVHAGATYVAVGESPVGAPILPAPTPAPPIWTSTDALHWTRAAAASVFPSQGRLLVNGLAWTGSRFVAVGNVLGGSQPYAWTSRDGRAWDATDMTATFPAAPTGGAEPAAVAVVGSTVLAVGWSSGSATEPVAWESTDGANWTRVDLPAFLAGIALRGIDSSNGQAIVHGEQVDADGQVSQGSAVQWTLTAAPETTASPSPAPASWPTSLSGPVAGPEGPFVSGSDGTVYLATAPWGKDGQAALVALGPGGPKPGWPFAPAGVAAFDAPVAGPDGTVYVNGWRYGNGSQSTNDSAVWALDASGNVLQGWPVDVPGGAEGLAVAPDGTAYVIERTAAGGARVVTLDLEGRERLGWPVPLDGGLSCGGVSCGPVGALVATDGTFYAQVATSAAANAPIEIVALGPDGSIRPGWPVRVPGEAFALGPGGLVYAWGVETNGVPLPSTTPLRILRSTYTILGPDGRPRPGWPVTIQGPAAPPAIAPDGSILVTVGGEPGQAQRVEAIGTDGKVRTGWPYTLPSGVEAWSYGIGEGNPPRLSPPWLGPDGTAYVAVDHRGDVGSQGVIALAPDGTVRPGWPVWLPAGTQLQVQAALTTGGGGNLRAPAFAADGTIYVPVVRDNHGAVLAIGPDGGSRAGWPFVTSGQFQLVVGLLTGGDGTLYVATLSESGATEMARLYSVRPDGRPSP